MALAEARAAWQRTANRCLVQEDAKRAPKLASCTSMPPSIKQTDTGSPCDDSGRETPNTCSLPFNRTPPNSNLSPNSMLWLQMQPNYGCQKVLIDEQFNSSKGNMENCQVNESSADSESLFDNSTGNFATWDEKDVGSKEEEFRVCCSRNREELLEFGVKEHGGGINDEVFVGYEVSKNENDGFYFDSELSWTGTEKYTNTPWWRMADTEELALLVAERSLDLIENCDLPVPQNTHVKKDLNVDIYTVDKDASNLLSNRTPESDTRVHTSNGLTVGSSYRELRMSSEGQFVSRADKRLSPTHERLLEKHGLERDASKAGLLEALRHSQTRAREAERAAQQAFEEKEHVLKLVFEQASQLFAYKQWIQLLQLESTYIPFKNNTNQSVVPVTPPWTLQKTAKTRRTGQKSFSRKRVKRCRTRCNIGRYAVVFALGLGLVGAGLLLGWTVGWMLPTL